MNLSRAQYTKVNDDPDAAFKSAKELFQKEQFSLAYPVFKYLYSDGVVNSNIPVTVQLESKYYYIVCGLEMNENSAAPMAMEFIALEHNAPRIQMMCYHLGGYYFRKKDFDNAITYYADAGLDNLTNNEIAELKFNKGYAHFTLQQFNEAKPLFDVVRQLPKDSNYIDANYYYGFISFSEKKYDDALKAFAIAEKGNDYQNVVPFYIAEIYYFNGEHDKALEYAENAIKRGGQYYELQLKQLAGHLYFDKQKYAIARPYLEEFVKKSDKVSREDMYELAYCYYASGDWQKSIEGFIQIGGKEDSLAQNSMYLLANAYLKTDQKANARNAFLFCASNSSNPSQKEVSLFSYAKLSYELGYMDIALRELQNFITGYPNSGYLQEAKELEIRVFANTSNYKDALDLYESLPLLSETVKKVYPNIAYGRAVELVNDQRLDQSDELLNKIVQSPYNASIIQLVYFWKGEIAYRNGNIENAVNYFANYLKNPQANGEVNMVNARYNLAYCLLKKGNYADALQYFSLVARTISFSSGGLELDAYIRAADCYFMQKNYRQALTMYETVIRLNVKGADYALFQKAVIAGASDKNQDKIDLLQNLAKQYPNSPLLADANIEIADSYLADEKYAEAIQPLNLVLKDPSATAAWPQAYLKLGVANFNLNKNEESLNNFSQLVIKYPNSPESDEAIEYIRNIFIANQKPGDFIAFMKQNGKTVTYSEEDSLTFRAAQLKYEAQDFTNAKQGFTEYLSKFPDGKYSLEASYFSAEIAISNKDFNAALPFYNAVVAKSPNKFAERSTLQSARIYYFDLKDYTNAEKYYAQLKSLATQQENKLEAMRGLLRCQYKLQQWKDKDAVDNAQELLQEKGSATDDKMIANMIVAKNSQDDKDQQPDLAINTYKKVIGLGKSEYSAEAQYRIAEILLSQNKLADAEKAGFEVIKKYGSYEYWVTKSYILLGDVYFKEKDLFNAEATFKSVTENATIDELKKEAAEKLNQVILAKNEINKVDQQ
jgi:TolA-binding protein